MTAKIYYRREKLDRLNELGDIDGVEWQEIIPNEHGDWIDQRGDEFSTMKPIEDLFKIHSNGLKTSRDAWAWNFSREKVIENMKPIVSMMQLEFDENKIIDGQYRPFNREWIYFAKKVNGRVYQMPNLFPNRDAKNFLICVPGLGTSKPFMPFITNRIPDLGILSASQCFPRYYFDGFSITSMDFYICRSIERNLQRISKNLFRESKLSRDMISTKFLKSVNNWQIFI